jgi:serine/threonine protein kinase
VHKKVSKDKNIKKVSKDKRTKKEKKKEYKRYNGINKFANDLNNVIDYTIIEKVGEGAMGIAYKLTDQNGNSIIKKVYKNMDRKDPRFSNWHKRFMNEVTILAELSGEAHFPKLLYYDVENYEIYMTICGEKINRENAPKNWKKQLVEILDILKKHNIAHNSTAINNTCVKDDIIYFIDFASSGEYGARKRNLTRQIIKEATHIDDAFNSNKTRHIRSGQKSDLLN